MEKPNIILIQSDSHDGRVMGCMGHEAAYTPNMDVLAEQGILFRNTYCTSPVCVPSRASMWTGKYPHEVEAFNNDKGIAEDTFTFMTALISAGYNTQIIGRTDHLSGHHSLRNRLAAWTRASGLDLCRTDMLPRTIIKNDTGQRVREPDWNTADKAVDWIREYDEDEPFCLHVGFIQPHPGGGYTSSPYYLDKIDPDRMTLPPAEITHHPVYEYMKKAKCSSGPFPEDEIRSIRHHYCAMVAELDALAGSVVSAAEEKGIRDNTYIIYISDHGDMQMEHGQWRKSSMYESSVRVPLIIAGPGIAQNRSVSGVVSLIDLFPTMLEMAGIKPISGLSGRSLLPAAAGEELEDKPVYAEYNSSLQNTGSYMIRDGKWKYTAFPGFQPQLFNLEDDPDELNNLVSLNTDVTGELDLELRKEMDYPEIDRKAKMYDKARFRIWKRSLDRVEYLRTMQEVFPGFTDEHDVLLENWLFKEMN